VVCVLDDEPAVDEDMRYACGVLMRIVVGGPVGYSCRVKNDEICCKPRPDHTPAFQPEFFRRQTGHFENSLLQFEDLQIPHIPAQDAGKRSVITRMGHAFGHWAGSGQAEAPGAQEIAGMPFLAQAVTGVSGKDLPGLIDAHKQRLGSGIVLLIAETGDKAAVAAGVTSDLTARVSAVEVVRAAVSELGGKGGGGRPDMAQGGGSDYSKADAAIAAVKTLLEGK